MRGWWNMACWNGLHPDQQRRLIEVGNLPINYRVPGTPCPNGAEVAIETEDDEAPGPRFYCRPCAIEFLSSGSSTKWVNRGWPSALADLNVEPGGTWTSVDGHRWRLTDDGWEQEVKSG